MKTQAILLTAALALTLPGCTSARAAETPAATREAAAQTAERASQPAADDAGSAEQADPHALRTLAPGDGDGCYGLYYPDGDTMAGPLLGYADYRSMTVAPLCSAEGCTHDTDACTAYFPEGARLEGVRILDENSIVLLVRPESGLATLYLADRDGANRRALFDNGEDGTNVSYVSAGDMAWLADDTSLYFPYNDETPDTLTGYLAKVPLTGGEPERLYDMTGQNLHGGIGRGVVATVYDWSASESVPEYQLTDDMTVEEMQQAIDEYHAAALPLQGTHTLVWHDLDTGEEIPLLQWQSAQDGSGDPHAFAMEGDTVYWMSESGKSFGKTGLGGQEEIDVAWPDEIAAAIENGTAVFSDLEAVGGTLLVNLTTDNYQTRSRYAIDPATGRATETTLCYSSYGSERPVDVLTAQGDDLLVKFAQTSEETIALTPDGIPYQQSKTLSRIALISRADFLAGNANYREIEAKGYFTTEG